MNNQNEYAYIYKMEWFSTPRSRRSSTTMYFFHEKDTRWGHNWTKGLNGDDRCEIRVIKVDKNSNEYSSAVSNSKVPKCSEEVI